MDGKVEGLRELERMLNKVGDFPKHKQKELRAANKRIGRIGAKVVKNSLPRQSRDFVVYKKQPKGMRRKNPEIIRTIPSGTLKRSIRVWNVRRSKINVHMGVKEGGSVRFDGYFVKWVESGNVKKRRRTIGSKFHNAVIPRLELVRGRMQRIQLIAYKRIMDQHLARL